MWVHYCIPTFLAAKVQKLCQEALASRSMLPTSVANKCGMYSIREELIYIELRLLLLFSLSQEATTSLVYVDKYELSGP